ncbi:hypothetical protein BH23GEM1_BH23GEM1_06800 [soil metagenome]
MPYRLSKTKFYQGRQCHKQLWWRTHEKAAAELAVDSGTQAIFDQAREVGRRARAYVPGGVLIDFPPWEHSESVAATRAALAAGATVIYEAGFLADDVFVAADILLKEPDGFTLIEVKMGLGVKPEHYGDAAIQTYVARKSGLDVRRVEIMHLCRECVFPDLSNLFVRQDITEQVEKLLPAIPDEIAAQLAMLARGIPSVDPGDHCSKPRTCCFWERCWAPVPPDHVSTLYKIGRKARSYVEQGYHLISQLPESVALNETAARQRRAVVSGQIVVEDNLAAALGVITPPVAFLDFETVMVAIPCWGGCRPFQNVPVQFSCHTLDADGRQAESGWIATGAEDPRRELATRLVAACAGARTIVAYNASFESECIEALIAAAPELAEALRGIQSKLCDALPIVRENVYHPAFSGGFGLKAVLPALVPDLSYAHLPIHDGQTASRELARLIFTGATMTDPERETLRKDLSDYCSLDTLAMVRLVDALRTLSVRSVPA